ncbi:MAG TPA: hypothetical protein VM223_01730 [Planctomycetota bacterium]|nr:hypothetical protein [Planctomycetota bacterium]
MPIKVQAHEQQKLSPLRGFPGLTADDLTPLKAVHCRCIDCNGHHPAQVQKCDWGDRCSIWPWRMGVRPKDIKPELTPIRAIKKHCRQECEACLDTPDPLCALFVYRRGHNPRRKGTGGFRATEQWKRCRKKAVAV